MHRIVLYAKEIEAMVGFYTAHFGYHAVRDPHDRIVELRSENGGVTLLLHPAAKGQRQGQVQIKLVFDVGDVAGLRAGLMAQGVAVGPLHDGGGYLFANLKDPSLNAVSISGRGAKGG